MESTRKVLYTLVLVLLTACNGGGGPEENETNHDSHPTSNSSPIINDPGSLIILEGQKSVVKLTATDADQDPITFSITSGADKGLFTINSNTGDLAFLEPADYENPGDSNRNNQYEVTVSASDGKSSDTGSSDKISLTVKIIDALEGRVVDGPLAGSAVFVDLDADAVHDTNEPSGVTNSQGFFTINQPTSRAKLIAKGGTDTATGVALSEFILMADLPEDESAPVSITPITTLLAQITSSEEKQALLTKLGIEDSYQSFLSTDYWAMAEVGNQEAMQVQRINLNIGLLFQTSSNLKVDSANANLSSTIANSLVQMDNIDLTDSISIRSLLEDASNTLSLSLTDAQLNAMSDSVAMINAVIANPELNPTDNMATDITLAAQQQLQVNIEALVKGDITVDKFISDNAASSLFSGISAPKGAIDTDNDMLINLLDPDDDNDGVPDTRDPFPLDADQTPPTAKIETDRRSGTAPLIVNFDASNSIAGNSNNSIDAYLWDFGNGVQKTSRKVQNIYTSAGTYTVQLTVSNNEEYTHIATVSIEVGEGESSYSVSGKVSVRDNTYIDSDTNDENSNPVSNGTLYEIDSAQIIEAIPMQLAGYLNFPEAGNDGPLKEQGDLLDVYMIEALGGEVITLDIGSFRSDDDSNQSSTDIDLALYNQEGFLIDFSVNPSDESEVITLPNSQGSYYIEASLFSDVENPGYTATYRLTVDNFDQPDQSFNSNWSKEADFVLGDIIVKRTANCSFKSVNDLLGSNTVRPLHQKGSKSGPMLYSFGDRIVDLAKANTTNKSTITRFSKGQKNPSEIELKIATLRMAKKISSNPCVEYAEPNYRRHKSLTPSDPKYSEQWHYKKINLQDAWDTTTGNDTIKVAVLDTGIALNHPDLLSNQSEDGYDFLRDPQFSGDGDTIDSDPNDPGDGRDNPACDSSELPLSSFHGTHVAGTVGATTDNSLGVAGVDWNAKIMSVRVLGCGGGPDYDIAQGILYAAGLENDSDVVVSDRADVINMSLGSAYFNQTLADAVAKAVDAGVIVIAAAGNESTSIPSYPAALEGVVSVAATNEENAKAWFSNFGSNIDVAAPGVNILSTVGTIVSSQDGAVTHGYASYDGTSMAAPHVAGVVSLMKAVYGEMTPDDFDAILISGNITDDIGDSGRDDYFGYGLIDAKKAVEYAKQINDGSVQIPVTPVLGLSDSSIDFATVRTEAVITASNIGSKSSTVTITNIEIDNSFVSVASPTSSDGLGDYIIRIDRTGLPPGDHMSSVKFVSNAGDKTLLISFEVLDPNKRYYGNAGNIYLHLTNIDTGEITKINVPEPLNGEYAFNFPYVAAGSYTLKASNDLENNGVLCEGVEGCGYYGGDAETILEINADTAGIDFDLHY